ncbi:hypothetical protein QEZ40_005092 [Streptomyces katrae]|uniref:TetR family transcriptional regulator n=1 Tax=Streptomyces katrae TaxID=68223 RepID=A0ABT7H218_9ACTN|nr:hypothetical protein [Streptomyces katrae]MDK9499663.1 hypothetical protein [Streptomyces katrae]
MTSSSPKLSTARGGQAGPPERLLDVALDAVHGAPRRAHGS